MTVGAQQALRRTMEVFSDTTRFALACNHSSKIIEPIQSRCAILRFAPLAPAHLLRRLLEVCACEQVAYTPDGLQAILDAAQGDMRHALNSLQATATGMGLVSAAHVHAMVDTPPMARMQQILTHSAAGHVAPAADILRAMCRQGYAPLDVLGALFRAAKTATALDDKTQMLMIREIGLGHVRALDGMCSLLQLVGLLARLARLCMPGTALSYRHEE